MCPAGEAGALRSGTLPQQRGKSVYAGQLNQLATDALDANLGDAVSVTLESDFGLGMASG
jgi:hypothetical protein